MLRLPFRNKTWRGAAGEFAGSGTGASMDFQDHRAYSPGDDPRHINWNAYARTGQYSMKLFREEIRPVVDLIVDASPSMFFTSEKDTRTREIVRFLVDSSLSAGASVHIHAIGGTLADPLIKTPIHHLGEIPGATTLESQLARLPLRPAALRVFVSDLLFQADPTPLLRHLTHRQGTPIVFSPFLETEANPAWSGNYDFIDAEANTRHPHRIEPATLRRYRESYTAHFALWKEAAIRHQCPLARIPCEQPLIPALYQHALPVKALEPSK